MLARAWASWRDLGWQPVRGPAVAALLVVGALGALPSLNGRLHAACVALPQPGRRAHDRAARRWPTRARTRPTKASGRERRKRPTAKRLLGLDGLFDDPPSDPSGLRIEMQTRDPNVRIIWFASHTRPGDPQVLSGLLPRCSSPLALGRRAVAARRRGPSGDRRTGTGQDGREDGRTREEKLERPAPGMRAKVFGVKHQNAADLVNALRPLSSGATGAMFQPQRAAQHGDGARLPREPGGHRAGAQAPRRADAAPARRRGPHPGAAGLAPAGPRASIPPSWSRWSSS